jgi:hypothetical protein
MGRVLENKIDRLLKESASSEEFIYPLLVQNEAEKLMLIVNEHITCIDSVRKYYRSISSSREYRNRGFEKKISLNKFHKEVLRCWEMLPKGFVKDLYKLYNDPIENLIFNNKEDFQHIRYKMLELANNTLTKILTKGSTLKSSLFTRSIILFYLVQFAKMNIFKLEEEKFMDAELNLTDDLSLSQWESQFQAMMEDPLNKRLKKISIDLATKEAIDADRLLNKVAQEKITSGLGAGKNGPKNEDTISRFIGKLVTMDLATQVLNDWIQEILEKSKQYFKVSTKMETELFLESDYQQSFNDYPLLHPALQKFYLEDLVIIKQSKNYGINLYIDISGSMDSISLHQLDGQKISSLDFAKALTLELANQHLINHVYLFNHNIIEYQYDEESLAGIVATGGTNISTVVSHIRENEKNALVITDAMDRCDIYTPLAFFLGIKGANFSLFSKDVIHKYSKQEQIVLFDGKSLKNC